MWLWLRSSFSHSVMPEDPHVKPVVCSFGAPDCTGPIPVELRSLTALQELLVAQNKLTGKNNMSLAVSRRLWLAGLLKYHSPSRREFLVWESSKTGPCMLFVFLVQLAPEGGQCRCIWKPPATPQR